MSEKILIQQLQTWCKEKNIALQQIEDRLFEIPAFGKMYLLVPNFESTLKREVLILEGMHFNATEEEFEICTDKELVDYLMFQFGNRFYYCKPEVEDNDLNEPCLNVNLNDLMYVGESTVELPQFVHLGVHTEYEILNGSGLKNYINKAKFLGNNSVGLCDKHTLAGVLSFQLECEKKGLKAIIGATYDVVQKIDTTQTAQDTYEVKLYVANEQGWQNILQINKQVNVDNDKFILEQDLLQYGTGLICVLGRKSWLDFTNREQLYAKLPKFVLSFEKVYFQVDSVEFYDDRVDMQHLQFLNSYLKADANIRTSMPPVLINDSYYCEKDESIVKDYLNKVSKVASDYSEDQYYKTAEQTIEKLLPLYDDQDKFLNFYGWCIDGIEEIVGLCGGFRIETGERKFPTYEYTEGKTKEEFFNGLIAEGFDKLVVKADKDIDVYMDRVVHEREVIEKAGLIDYLLILWDIITWSKQNNIYIGTGRGSVCGSLVCYLIGITSVDSIQYDLMFERFLNEVRVMPENYFEVKLSNGETHHVREESFKDFKTKHKVVEKIPYQKFKVDAADIDFDTMSSERETVKAYIAARFGELHTCSIGTFTRLQLKGGIKDFGAVRGLKFAYLNFVTEKIDNQVSYTWRDFVDYAVHDKRGELNKFFRDYPEVVDVIKVTLGQPKAYSIHASAMLVLPKLNKAGLPVNVFNHLPVRLVEGKLISEWEGTKCDAAGFLKEDVLGLEQLDKFQNMLNLIKQNHNVDVDLNNIPYDDKKTFRLFHKGWNEDVFQFNSQGLKQYSRLVKPDNFEDLAAMNSLYRPGPMEANAHKDFADFKHGKKTVKYNFNLKEISEKTMGLLIYQEQVMQAVIKVGGYSASESDDFRKQIKKFDRKAMAESHEKFAEGARRNGCPEKEIETIWNKILAFGGYGFNRSHSVAYSMLSYQSQWLKANYPLEFWTTALQFAEEKEIPAIISEMRKVNREITLRSPSINNSQLYFSCDTETNSIYWSLIKIKDIGIRVAQKIIEVRNKVKIFADYDHFVASVPKKDVNRKHLTHLILAGAFDEIQGIRRPIDRRDLLEYHARTREVDISKYFDERTMTKNYQWVMHQKELSGLGEIDYTEVIRNHDRKLLADYVDYDALQKRKEYGDVYVCGQVVEVIRMKKKKKDEFFFIIKMIHNYDEIKLLIWEEVSMEHAEQIKTFINKFYIVKGKAKFDVWNNAKSVYVSEWDESFIAI